QAAGIGRKHRIAIEMIINAIKDELAHLQHQLNTDIRPDAAEVARAIGGAIDDLEQRLHTIMEEKSATRVFEGMIRSLSTSASQKHSALIVVTVAVICLALIGSMALTVDPHVSTSLEISSAQTDRVPSEAAQTPQVDVPAASPATKRSVQLQVNRSL